MDQYEIPHVREMTVHTIGSMELPFGEDVAVSYLMGYNRQDVRLNHKDVRLEKYIIISLSLR